MLRLYKDCVISGFIKIAHMRYRYNEDGRLDIRGNTHNHTIGVRRRDTHI